MTRVAHRRSRRGFTLVELIVACAIIGILTRIAIPNVVHMRNKARATAIVAELRIVRDASFSYYADSHVWPLNAAVGSMPRELKPYLSGSFQSFARSKSYRYAWLLRGMPGGDPNSATANALMGVGVSTSDKALFAQVQKVLGKSPSYVTGTTVYVLIWGPGFVPERGDASGRGQVHAEPRFACALRASATDSPRRPSPAPFGSPRDSS